MTILTLDNIVAGFASGQRRPYYKQSVTSAVATFHSLWGVAGYPGAAGTPPSGDGEIPTSSTSGAIPFTNPGGGNSSYLGLFSSGCSANGTTIIYDRLWHNSGFSGTSTSAQTITNPPTLTRPDANGANVELWLEVYSIFGATPATFTATYTDQDGNGSQSATFTTTGAPVAGQMFPFALAAGDTGVRTVSQVQLSGSTGTAGNFGLVLLRRIAEINLSSPGVTLLADFATSGMPQIYDSACLALMQFSAGATTGNATGTAVVIQGK